MFKEVCYKHLAKLAEKFKLQDMTSWKDLRKALDLIYERQGKAWELRINPNTYSLFLLDCRPAWPEPILGLAWFPTLEQPFFEPAIDQL